MPAAVNTASNAVVNLASRSRIRYRNRCTRSSRSISRFRACWVAHAPVGWAVIPARWLMPKDRDLDLVGIRRWIAPEHAQHPPDDH
jgi:hypothetical protein